MAQHPHNPEIAQGFALVTTAVCGSLFLLCGFTVWQFGNPLSNFGKVAMVLLAFGALAGVLAAFSSHIGRASARAFYLIMTLLCLYWCVQSSGERLLDVSHAFVFFAIAVVSFLLRRSFIDPSALKRDTL